MIVPIFSVIFYDEPEQSGTSAALPTGFYDILIP